MLSAIEDTLHLSGDVPPKSLGSRNLLQRLTMLAAILDTFHPKITEIAELVRTGERKVALDSLDLRTELDSIHKKVREDFAPLAFLYDVRTHAGIAHAPNKKYVQEAAKQLGLPDRNWSRRDYMLLLNMITAAIGKVSDYLWAAISPRQRGWPLPNR
jgi:hypothetical protein